MSRPVFYYLVAALTVLNGYLLSKPNLLGKIGLILYKYYYLRTFPRTLLTVSVICAAAIIFTELISLIVRKGLVTRIVGMVICMLFTGLAFAQLVKTGIDFSSWSYSHTGLRFRLGAFLLPTMLIGIFTYGWLTLPKHAPLRELADEVVSTKD